MTPQPLTGASMNSDAVFCFPLELEREIFETAALQNLDTIPTLLRVSRRVHVWVEPLLYRIVVIPDRTAPILPAVQAKPPPFLQLAVHHLFIQPQMAGAVDIIRSCSGIHSLFLDGRPDTNLLDILDRMQLRRFNFTVPSSLSGWAEGIFTRPTFLRVTHLELFQDLPHGSAHLSWRHWSPLATLPALTHLCLAESQASLILPDVVAECAQLLIIVTAWWGLGTYKPRVFAQTLTVTDPRVVVILIDSYIEDWKLGAAGGADFWVRAEIFVARKRRGEIPSKNHFSP
ncbi:hypothetical protein C8R46DRAFT_496437 [Mycena filopes]|nr:hypothetical protein C8R46DRAFT_496437 [Mycena filopes]